MRSVPLEGFWGVWNKKKMDQFWGGRILGKKVEEGPGCKKAHDQTNQVY